MKRAKNLLMELQPVWGVELFNLRYNYFCFEPIVIFVFLDFVLYEYSSFSSSRNSFYILESGRTVQKFSSFSLILGTKILVKIGTQHMDVVVYLTNLYEESHLHPYSRLNFAMKVEKWSLFFCPYFFISSPK